MKDLRLKKTVKNQNHRLNNNHIFRATDILSYFNEVITRSFLHKNEIEMLIKETISETV